MPRKPTEQEMVEWERIAALQDEAPVVIERVPRYSLLVTLVRNSRGGTRTRDPGIMSAVL